MSTRPVRIGTCSGFSGDRLTALREVLDGDPVDVVVGDYLAEVTMAAMVGRAASGRGTGWSGAFLAQLDGNLADLLTRRVKLVVNAGAFDPAGLAEQVRKMAARDGRQVSVAHVEGDHVLDRIDDLQAAGHLLENLDTGEPLSSWPHRPTSANAYLGGWGIAAALAAGADVVICPRVTDASLVVGAAAWWHRWHTDDWDRLAGAVVAGHVVECGPQATGGNFSGFRAIPELVHPGFPVAEIDADGSAVVTKHTAAGGAVTTDTVTAQLLYEIQGPIYLNPDVTVDLRTVRLESDGPDRVMVHGATGTPPSPTTKVAITAVGGYENSFAAYLTGLDVEAKAAIVEAQARHALAGSDATILRVDLVGTAGPDPATLEEATATLRFVGRAATAEPLKPANFYLPVASTILGSVPGFHCDSHTGRSTRPSPVVEYWPALLAVDQLHHVVVHDDGTRQSIPGPPAAQPAPVVPPQDGRMTDPSQADTDTVRVPLGRVAHARSGDKGGNSNVGIWTGPPAWSWLRGALSASRFRELFPEARGLPVTRHEFANLNAVHFVVHGNLGSGASSNGRLDALGKSVGEYLRARHLDVPRRLIDPDAADERRANGGRRP